VYASTKRPLWYCGRYVVVCRNRSGLNGAILGAIGARDHEEKVELLPCAAASNGVRSRDMTGADELSREELAALLDLAGELSTQVDSSINKTHAP
jgi:hypothetical protein